jgi:histidine ammonia-lyase
MNNTLKSWITLGDHLSLEDFIQVARYHVPVNFSDDYEKRVNKARALVDKWTEEEKPMYGVTTGFGKASGGRLKNKYPKGLRTLK